MKKKTAHALPRKWDSRAGEPKLTLRRSFLAGSTGAFARRGLLAVGMVADVVIFDPERVEDKATFDNPFQYPVGLSVVIVNGAVTLRDGHRNPTGSGRALRAA